MAALLPIMAGIGGAMTVADLLGVTARAGIGNPQASQGELASMLFDGSQYGRETARLSAENRFVNRAMKEREALFEGVSSTLREHSFKQAMEETSLASLLVPRLPQIKAMTLRSMPSFAEVAASIGVDL